MNAIKRLSDEEYYVLDVILTKTKMDCWCSLRTDSKGNDYVYDIEERKRIPLRDAIAIVMDGVGCKENLDACNFTPGNVFVLKNLLERMNIGGYEDIVKI